VPPSLLGWRSDDGAIGGIRKSGFSSSPSSRSYRSRKDGRLIGSGKMVGVGRGRRDGRWWGRVFDDDNFTEVTVAVELFYLAVADGVLQRALPFSSWDGWGADLVLIEAVSGLMRITRHDLGMHLLYSSLHRA